MQAVDPPASLPGEPAPIQDGTRVGAESAGSDLEVLRWKDGQSSRTMDRVAEEMPIALMYHGVPHVVMLATPADLVDFAYGFSVSEELVANASEIRSVEIEPVPEAVEVRVSIAWERFPELLRRRRNLTGRTGCGLCGSETLDQAIRCETRVGTGPTITSAELHAAIVQLESAQPLNARTGSVHAAAWVSPGQGIQLVREDVGRHNALDKAIGALARAGTDFGAGYMLVTSRASYEMVQKAAAVGITFLSAMSAPTAYAVRTAQRAGLTLVAFARRERHVVYAHPHRLIA